MQLPIASAKTNQLLAFIDLLHKWNKIVNLTAISDKKQMLIHHLLDSVSVAQYIEGTRIIDVGSGGGLPGIPLAILQPQKNFVLLDARAKKTRFIKQVVIELKLSNVEVVTSRVEAYQVETAFDIVITRAFSNASNVLSKTQHLFTQGKILLMKGELPSEELKQLPSNMQTTIIPLVVPGIKQRHLISIKRKSGVT